MKLLFIVIPILFLCHNAAALPAIDVSKPDFSGKMLGKKTEWYQGDESIYEVSAPEFSDRFQIGDKPALNFGFTNKNYWFRHRFYNPSEQPFTIYVFDHVNVTKVARVFVGERLVADFTHSDLGKSRIAEITLSPKTTTDVYVQRQTDHILRMGWVFWSDLFDLADDIADREQFLSVLLAIFFMAILFNMALFFVYKARLYFYYLLNIISVALFAMIVTSVYYIPFLTEYSSGVETLIGLSGIFSLLCTYEFLSIRTRYPRLNICFKFIFIISCLTATSLSLELNLLTKNLSTKIYGISMALCFLFSIYVFLKERYFHLLIYTFGYGIFLVGTVIQAIIWADALPKVFPFYSNVIFVYATALENIFMLLAMGNKIYITEKQRVHGYSELAKLFFPHQLKMIESGKKIETTMPVGNGEALVIAFDVVGSSKIPHDEFASLMEDFSGKCRDLMMEGYCEDKLVSSGFMIKEMGDGFLCSVGFPFQAPTNATADCAVELAEKIMNLFRVHSKELTQKYTVHCSAGISRGDVNSFFSKSGVIRYDLWGRAIVHAVRYEALRSKIFQNITKKTEDIIIIQDSVYDGLSPEIRASFCLVELENYQFRVRDDERAKRLAYKLLQANGLEEDNVA
ncbi:MAG: hypothetical protein HRU19_02750 [Pseudobacteriovorax sp.]|nr:hypothetical protein [Pseudobacteriovorax sp.]